MGGSGKTGMLGLLQPRECILSGSRSLFLTNLYCFSNSLTHYISLSHQRESVKWPYYNDHEGKGQLFFAGDREFPDYLLQSFHRDSRANVMLPKMSYCSLNYIAMLRAPVSYCPLSQATTISKNLAVPSCKSIVATGFIDFLHSLMEEWKGHKTFTWYPTIPYHLLYATLPSLQVTLGSDQE